MKLTKQELIGKNAKVTSSDNESLVGIRGRVVNETKNALVLESEGERKKALKEQCTFEIDGQTVEGERLTERPEERTKRGKT